MTVFFIFYNKYLLANFAVGWLGRLSDNGLEFYFISIKKKVGNVRNATCEEARRHWPDCYLSRQK